MSIADKLVTIAENEQRVYKAGQLNVLANAESLNGSLSGEAVSANDVIGIEHSVGCNVSSKNLLDVSNIMGTSVTAYGGTLTCGADGGITGSGTPTSSVNFPGLPGLYLPKGIYTLSRSGTFTNIACSLYLRDVNGTQLMSFNVSDIRKNYTVDLYNYPTYSYMSMEIKRANNNVEMSGTAYFQLEAGSTATAYTPYVSDFSSVNVSRYGKNLLDISNNIGKTVSANGGTLTCGADGGITGSGTPTSSVAFPSLRLYLPKGIYTLSVTGEFNNISCVIYLRDSNNKSLAVFAVNELAQNKKVTINTNDYSDFAYFTNEIKRNNNNIEMSGTAYFQLELGETATNYELFKLPTNYTANADGTVNGITSIAPSMTLLSNTEGVVINANYYKDPDIVISNLAQSVALSGGEG